MEETLIARLDAVLLLTKKLSENVDESALYRCIDGVPSNSIGSQFWCLVGARESYARAIAAGGWQGFSCSLSREQTKEPSSIQSALDVTRGRILDAIANTKMLASRSHLVFDVWEHEVLHQGQLVRYFYANGIRFPEEFASRYALDQPKFAANS